MLDERGIMLVPHVMYHVGSRDKTRRQTLMHRTVLQPVTHTLYTIVSSIVLNIIETDFRTNVRFRILVRHGRLSDKLISVVGQMS